MSIVIKNGSVYTNDELTAADIRVDGGVITEIAPQMKAGDGDEIIDAGGKIVLPGIIDAHVHYYMLGDTNERNADSFETGSLSAAFGGVTTFIDFAPPVAGKPLTESLEHRKNEADGHSYIDYTFHMEITDECAGRINQLKDLKNSGINSLKIYTTYGDSKLSAENTAKLLEEAAKQGMLVIAHAEDDGILNGAKQTLLRENKTAPEFHAAARPPEAEAEAVKKTIETAKEKNAAVYFVHVSTAEGVGLIEKATAEGVQVFCETCPHYLLLTDELYKKPDASLYVMSPPLRKKRDNEALWEGIQKGVIDCVVTDHCAYKLSDKLSVRSCFGGLNGIGGSETLLPVMFTEGVNKGRININELVALLSENPARLFGIYPQKGKIAVGSDADFVVLDENLRVTLKGDALHSAAGYTVFEGFEAQGYPVMTISRGRVICADGKAIAEKPNGKFISVTAD